MSRFKLAFTTYLLPLTAALIVACGYEQANQSSLQLCKHQYALCTSALCIPQPDDPTKAICFCDVEEGASMSSMPCKNLQPTTDVNGIRTIYSAFSLEQFNQGKKGMTCPNGTPWTWCLNKRCTVNPTNSKRAICVCDVLRTGDWMTLGGDCKTATCKTGYWSGASMKDFNEGQTFMMKALGLDQSPVKWCQAVSP